MGSFAERHRPQRNEEDQNAESDSVRVIGKKVRWPEQENSHRGHVKNRGKSQSQMKRPKQQTGNVAKAGCRHCPGLRLGRGWSWLVCPWRASGSFRREQHANCAGEDAQVQPQTPVLDVGEIKVHVELKRGTVACRNLPQTRDARFHVQSPELVKFVVVDLVDRMRPRSDQAHLPAQHVPELREFVEAVAADDTADRG